MKSCLLAFFITHFDFHIKILLRHTRVDNITIKEKRFSYPVLEMTRFQVLFPMKMQIWMSSGSCSRCSWMDWILQTYLNYSLNLQKIIEDHSAEFNLLLSVSNPVIQFTHRGALLFKSNINKIKSWLDFNKPNRITYLIWGKVFYMAVCICINENIINIWTCLFILLVNPFTLLPAFNSMFVCASKNPESSSNYIH